jgi:hypothetical protein
VPYFNAYFRALRDISPVAYTGPADASILAKMSCRELGKYGADFRGRWRWRWMWMWMWRWRWRRMER